MDDQAVALARRAAQGGGLTRGEVARLLSFDPESPTALAIDEIALELGRRVAKNRAFVHGQIGVDSNPCPVNCAFCSFAQANGASGQDAFQLDAATVASLARELSQAGANLVSLMATAALPFAALREMVAAASEAMGDGAVLLVNAADMTLEQAQSLREAGAHAAYHALRLGEGRLTGIDPARRLQTMENIAKAGLALMTGVEPIWDGADEREIVEGIFLMPRLEPVWTGACGLSAAPGTPLAKAGPLNRARVRQVGALVRLVAGERIPVGGVGGVVWVDAGADPRARGVSGEEGQLKAMVRAAQKRLSNEGWRVATQEESMLVCRERSCARIGA